MRYFSDGKKHMLVVYREEIVDQLAVEIANLDFGNEKLKIYIFSPARYAFNDNFAEVSEKVTLVALPATIYDAYEKVLPKRKEKLFELVEVARVASETTQDLFSVQEEGGEQ
jgi:adenine-specific DNA-methyltransferase